jgi:cell division protein FtsB
LASDRPVVALPAEVREQLARELREVRSKAVAGYTEVDLLIAAMKEHIADLRSERDTLRRQVSQLQDSLAAVSEERRRVTAQWMWRGTKPLRAHR